MTMMSQENGATVAGSPADQTTPSSSGAEQNAAGWTIISKPGAVVEISTRPLPDRIREAISRNLGIGTGVPGER